MKTSKRLLSLLLVFVLLFALCGSAFAADSGTEDIVVLYTNDVHTYIDKTLSYASIAELKDEYETEGKNVLLVDAGDHIQGTAYGSMDKGATIMQLMEAAGYDLATLGNHEFDYGMARALEITTGAVPYVSCNFYHEKDGVAGESVLDAYKVFDLAGKRVALVGITTPESFTKSTPAYFQDENGNYIYGIAGGTDGAALYAAVQKAVDAARAEADYVIALGHLGDDPSSQPWTSGEVIANTTGIDAFIDGHSHNTVEMLAVKNKSGEDVILTQTGSYFAAIGELTIAADGTIQTRLITDYAGSDPDVKAIETAWMEEIDTKLGEVIGRAEVTLDNYDAAGNRLVRSGETNTGDFAADALYYLFDNMGLDVDVAIMNGGGVRNKAVTGELSYKTCKDIHTFGNVACLQTITGQQLLDALEWGSRDVGTAECGGFLQVSGITYEIDTTIPSTVQKDEKGVWTGGPTGAYRVKNVMVGGEPLDLSASYNLAGYNYTLRDLGDGFNMFAGAVNVLDYVMEDYMVLANYIQSFPAGEDGLPVITAENSPYAALTGEGRITVRGAFADVAATAWYYEAVQYVYENGLMQGVGGDAFAPATHMNRAMLVTMLYNMEGKPAVEGKAGEIFSDVADDAWYADAVVWASANEIVSGMGDGTFAPTADLTRQQMAAMFYNYMLFKDWDVSVGEDTNILSYTDAQDIAEWAIPAVQWACGAGLMQGNPDGSFDPKGTANRAMGATLLMRFNEMEKTPAVYPVGAFAVTEISKYGNITLDMTCDDFLAKGYAYGDTVTVTMGRKSITVPFVSNYSDVDNGSAAVLCRAGDEYVTAAINMGNFAGTYGLEVGDTLDIELAVAGAYKDEYLIRQLTRTDLREDYASDEVFANFRPVTVGDIAEGVLYRSSSPVNPEIGRNTYADALARAAGIKTFINLADSPEVLTAYEGYADSYYKTVYDAGGVIALNMGVDFAAADFQTKLAQGLRFLAQAEGPVLIHCNEGKDRAGFVTALLECLMGATVDEMVDDYMLSYINYYHVEQGSEQYEAIANSNIRATLASIAGLEKGADLSGVDFAAAAEAYLKNIGLTDSEIDAIQLLLAPAAQALAA